MSESADRRQHASTFWFGFAMGTVILGTAAFLLGTKKGRTTLHKVLELSENLEENIIEFAQEAEELVDEKVDDVRKQSASHKSTSSVDDKNTSLSGILHKMHFFTQPKSNKKVFTKESK